MNANQIIAEDKDLLKNIELSKDALRQAEASIKASQPMAAFAELSRAKAFADAAIGLLDKLTLQRDVTALAALEGEESELETIAHACRSSRSWQ